MNFLEFKKSLSEKNLHVVSGEEKNEYGYEFKEPCYLLETSGSSVKKSFIHSLSSIESASMSFLNQFDLSHQDRWGLCLSTHHVAGFSILARSYFGGLKSPYQFHWDINTFEEEILKNEVTIVSLVPTQVFDLVNRGIKAPEGFKFLFVGGAFISKNLIDEAVALGWPLVVCYGSTETFAQMSFSSDGEFFKPYKGWEMRVTSSNEVELKGGGLYFAEVINGRVELRAGDWFKTGDLGAVDGEWFSLKGKKNGLVKIKGSYFDFNAFKKRLLKASNLDFKNTFPVVLEEGRNGAGVYLVTTLKTAEIDVFLEEQVEIRGVFKIDENVFSSIGKVQKSKLESVLLKKILCL